MKLVIEKTASLIIDTSLERIRINKAFCRKRNKKNRQMLNKLMDLIEQCKWKEAKKELKSKWWNGYDKYLECSRGEFIGMVQGYKSSSPFFDRWMSYADLVFAFINYPENYKIKEIK